MAEAAATTSSSPRERAASLAERHRLSSARRRQRLARDQERGASAETIAGHRAALIRLDRLTEEALTRVDELDLDAKFAAEKAVAEDRQRADLLKVATRVEAFAAGMRRAREKAEGSRTREQRRRDRQLHRQPLTARDRDMDVAERRVDDPYEPGTQRFTPVNRRVDILETERAHRRITEQQFALGRIVQAVFERVSGRIGSSGWNAGSRVDAVTARELSMIYAVDDARKVQAYMDRIARALGQIDTRLLRRILGERMSFAEVSAITGKGSGEKGTRYVAERFRDALDVLVEAWAARGRAIIDPADKHDRRAAAIEGREVGSHRRVSATTAPRGGEETDERGVVVPAGRGYRWGR